MNNNLKKGQNAEKKIEKTLKGSKRTIGSGNFFQMLTSNLKIF